MPSSFYHVQTSAHFDRLIKSWPRSILTLSSVLKKLSTSFLLIRTTTQINIPLKSSKAFLRARVNTGFVLEDSAFATTSWAKMFYYTIADYGAKIHIKFI